MQYPHGGAGPLAGIVRIQKTCPRQGTEPGTDTGDSGSRAGLRQCVSYSGQCYLSQYLTGRSANRGCCIQACRSRYDLLDTDGRTILKDKAILSLKDFSLQDRLEHLAEAGATSFKIEGRLKNISYVRNIVRSYSDTLDALIKSSQGKYVRPQFLGLAHRRIHAAPGGHIQPGLYALFHRRQKR